jgi:hypothetical protein
MINNKTTLILALPALCISGTAAAEGEEEQLVTISGFVDTSLYMPVSGFPQDADEPSFGLDQVEVDFTIAPGDGLMLQADINVFPSDGTPLTGDSLFEQGFLDYEHGSGFFVRAGKANAPIGAEGIDPTDLYQYSQGQLFTSATPSNLTGLFTGYRSDTFSGQLWLTNEWDTPGTPLSASPGARVEYAFSSGAVGLSSTIGPLSSDDPYIMVDVDASVGVGDLTILGEVNFGTSDALESVGALATFSYAISSIAAATVRVDYLSQKATEGDVVFEQGTISLTGAGLFSVTDNFGIVTEVRADISDAEGADPEISAALELLAFF